MSEARPLALGLRVLFGINRKIVLLRVVFCRVRSTRGMVWYGLCEICKVAAEVSLVLMDTAVLGCTAVSRVFVAREKNGRAKQRSSTVAHQSVSLPVFLVRCFLPFASCHDTSQKLVSRRRHDCAPPDTSIYPCRPDGFWLFFSLFRVYTCNPPSSD